jgi:hypothetical protein
VVPVAAVAGTVVRMVASRPTATAGTAAWRRSERLYHLSPSGDYRLKIAESLTLKPQGFRLAPRRRTTADRADTTTGTGRPPAASVIL